MKLRRSLAALLGLGLLAAALGIFIAAPSAEGRAARRVSLQRAAEWGVWKMHAGHVTSLEELAAELPPFVHRGRPSATPPPTAVPVVPYHPVQARKPVLYLYSSEVCRATGVQIHVGLRVGGSTLYYPQATASHHGLDFRGVLYPAQLTRDCPTPTGMPRAPRGHFWNDLRAVPASVFETSSGEAEHFIFYDALTDLRVPFVFYGAGEHGSVSARPGRQPQVGVDDVVYVVHGGRYRRLVPSGPSPTPIAGGDSRPMQTLEGELRSQLLARGLTADEAQSLLATWYPDLIEAQGHRRIYFVDRADYDAMLPLTISPRPRQMVRVGLVIDIP